MKLSTKLFIGLFAVLFILLIWQALISNQVINDREKLQEEMSADDQFQLFKQLKTYEQIEVSSFSNIIIQHNIRVTIIKSKQLGIFINKYLSPKIETKSTNNAILIEGPVNEDLALHASPDLYLFMPNEPESLCINDGRGQHITLSGFDGKGLIISLKNAEHAVLYTDMPNLHINQQNSTLNLNPSSHDFKKTMESRYLQANISNGRFQFGENNSKSLNADIKLDNGNIVVDIKPETHLEKINIRGSLNEDSPHKYYKNRVSYNSQCDSLLIDLVSQKNKISALTLNNIEGRYEDIRHSENISILRVKADPSEK